MRDRLACTGALASILAACATGAPAGSPSKPAASQPAAAQSSGAQAPAAQTAPAGPPAVIRWSTIANANQSYFPVRMQEKGIGAKYGIDVQITPISNTGQQWNSMRAGEADISSGSVLDLLRQRQAGLQAKAIRNWATFSNPV